MNNTWHTRRTSLGIYSLYVAVAAIPFSVLVCHLAIIVFLLCWICEKDLLQRLILLKQNYQTLALIGFCLTMCVGVIYSQNKGEAWFALERKLFFFLLPIAFATSSIISRQFTQQIFSIFCYSCGLALLVCYAHAWNEFRLFEKGLVGQDVLNYLSSAVHVGESASEKQWMFFSYVRLAAGLKMHPTYLSLYAAFSCVILTHRNLSPETPRREAVINFLLLLFFSVSIIFLSARVVVLMLCLFYALTLVYQVAARKRMVFQFLVPVLLLIVLAGIMVNPVTRYRQVDEILTTDVSVSENKNYTNSTGIRASLWWLSAKTAYESNWVFGVGPGDVKSAVQATGKKYGVTNILNSYDPHNEYLYILLSSGLIGMSFFAAFVGVPLVKAMRNRDIIFLNFLVLFLMVCLTESVLELQKGIVFFSIFFSSMSRLTTEQDAILHLNLAGARE